MPTQRRDPFLGNLPPMQPPAQDPQQAMQNPQAGGPQDASNLIWQMIQKNLGATPPAPRRLSNWEIFAGLTNPDLMNTVLGRRYDTPEAMQYEAGQKALPSMVQAYGATQRGQHLGQREARLEEQFRWRQLLQSQYKRTPTNLFNPETGLNEQWIIFSDPLNNNVEVGRVPSSFSQMHYATVQGPGGDVFQGPSGPKPPPGSMPGGGPAMGGMGGAPTGGPPASRPQSNVPTSGANVTGMLPSGAPNTGRPPMPSNWKKVGVTGEAPAGPAGQAAGRTAFAIGLDPLMGLQKQAFASQGKQFGTTGGVSLSDPMGSLGNIASLVGQNIADYAARSPSLQPAISGDLQNVKNYNVNMLPSLFSYTKSQTGAQFGWEEFERYRGSFPTSMDDEFTATEKIGSLLRIVRAEVISQQQQFHGIEIDPRFTQYNMRVMQRANFNRLSAEDRIAFVAGGGIVR